MFNWLEEKTKAKSKVGRVMEVMTKNTGSNFLGGGGGGVCGT